LTRDPSLSPFDLTEALRRDRLLPSLFNSFPRSVPLSFCAPQYRSFCDQEPPSFKASPPPRCPCPFFRCERNIESRFLYNRNHHPFSSPLPPKGTFFRFVDCEDLFRLCSSPPSALSKQAEDYLFFRSPVMIDAPSTRFFNLKSPRVLIPRPGLAGPEHGGSMEFTTLSPPTTLYPREKQQSQFFHSTSPKRN